MASEDFRSVQTKWVEQAISSEKYCDAVFIVGKERSRMFGFRGLLANISPVFEAQFYGNFREAHTHEPIEYPTISPTVFKCIIRSSMNLDPNINAENVMELIQVSQMLQIRDLQKECAGFLENNLNVNNVLFVLNAGYCLNSLNKKFYKKSLRIALKNPSTMISNKGFYSLHPDLLISFLKSNCFKVKEELLWNASLKWAQNVFNKGLEFNNYNTCTINTSIIQNNTTIINNINNNKVNKEKKRKNKKKIVKLSLSDFDDDSDDSDDNCNEENDENDEKEEKKQIEIEIEIDDEFEMKIDEKNDDKIRETLEPIIPYLRFALMDKEFFIDNVAKYLSSLQRDAVYIHYILPSRETSIFNDTQRIEYSNKKFDIVDSNVRLDKAKMLNIVDDWWSHTNFASIQPQWFIVKLPDPAFIITINWKNRWGDGETAKDIELQCSKNPYSYLKNNNQWVTFWTFKSEKTSNWLTFQVPQNNNHNVKPSMYWRFVIKTLYGDNSCRCGLDQIKITNSL